MHPSPPCLPTPRRLLLARGAPLSLVAADLRAGRTRSVFRGVHVDAAHADGLQVRARAAVATQRGAGALTSTTAAVLQQLRWTPAEWAEQSVVHLAVPGGDTRKRHRDGLRLHWRQMPQCDVEVVDGVPCFTVTRTLVELARDPAQPPLLVVQLCDGALADERTTPRALHDCLSRLRGQRGIARARRVIGRARIRVGSPQETRMRLLLEDGGIDGIEVDVTIRDDDGMVLARGDLGIPQLLLWGEYDGYDVHSGRRQFRDDRIGDRWLSNRGWQVMRFVDEDLGRPGRLLAEWRQAVADAPARIAALPATRSPEVARARAALGLDGH